MFNQFFTSVFRIRKYLRVSVSSREAFEYVLVRFWNSFELDFC